MQIDKRQRLTARQRRLIKAGKITIEDALTGVGLDTHQDPLPLQPQPNPNSVMKKQVCSFDSSSFIEYFTDL